MRKTRLDADLSSYHYLSTAQRAGLVPGAGGTCLDRRNREQATRQYVKQLERLGHRVILEPVS